MQTVKRVVAVLVLGFLMLGSVGRADPSPSDGGGLKPCARCSKVAPGPGTETPAPKKP